MAREMEEVRGGEVDVGGVDMKKWWRELCDFSIPSDCAGEA